MTFREEWVDSRLAYGDRWQNKSVQVPSYVNLQAVHDIWRPDTFFQNEKESRKHMIDKPNVLLRIYRWQSIVQCQVWWSLNNFCLCNPLVLTFLFSGFH